MNRLRLTDVRSTIAEVMNVCTTSTKIPAKVNEVQARLMSKGKWVGTVVSYRICAGDDSCLVWPRQIETIEAWALCNNPGTVRNGWYEMAGQGPGILKASDNWFRTLIDKDPVCAFDELGSNTLTKRIQVQADVTEAAGLRILLQGYDQNANWIRTQDALNNNAWVDGEYVSISTTVARTTKYFTKLTGVQKPATNGPVRLSEYDDTGALVIKQLAYYENDETTPIYRRSFLPGMQNISGCDTASTGSTCTNKSVTVIAKLRHIDVVNDNDWLILGNIGAFKLGVQAVLKENRNLFAEAQAYWAAALKELQDELSSYMGDGVFPVLRTEDRETWGAGVLNVIDTNYFFYY